MSKRINPLNSNVDLASCANQMHFVGVADLNCDDGRTVLGTRIKPAATAAFNDSADHEFKDTQMDDVSIITFNGLTDQLEPDTQNSCVSQANFSNDRAGQPYFDTHDIHAGVIAQIRETHRQRQDLHRAEKSLTLQIKSIARRLSHTSGQALQQLSPTISMLVPDVSLSCVDHPSVDTQNRNVSTAFLASLPLEEARAGIKTSRMRIERQLTKLAKQLPAYAFVESIHGMGALGFAQIVGEAGDLANYANPAKLWKRMGLAVINGRSQRRVTGAEALEHGYNAVRRSIMYCIGDSMIKKQNDYRELYLARKGFELAKLPDATKILIHRRAQRYMEKRLLRNLWRYWNHVPEGNTP